MSVPAARAATLITSVAKTLVLNPVVTAPLLWLLTKAPEEYRLKFLNALGPLYNPEKLPKFIEYLRIAFTLGIVRGVNGTLNGWALRKWKLRNNTNWVWNQEIAVITGGCGGIGEKIVQGLVAKDIKVAIIDVQPLPDHFRNDKRVQYFKCDITDEAKVKETAAEIKEKVGTPTILINNAGIASKDTIMETSNEYLHKIFDVNVISNYSTVKAFLPDMLAARKGHIVTVASCASFVSVAGLVDYCASKAAVLAFHEGLAQELKHRHKVPEILTTSIHPHWTNTRLCDSFAGALESTHQFVLSPQTVADKVVKQILSGKSGQVIIPEAFDIMALLKGMPHWVQEGLRDTLGWSVA